MILLFTSSNDDYPLYKRDLLNVCCEPSGANMQFAYKHERISKDLRSGKNMKDQGVLVVFCETVSKKAPFYTYHPIRLGKIVKDPNSEHGSLNITFELQGFFNYEKYRQGSGIDDFTDKFQQYILKDDKHPGGKEPYCWVRKEKDELNEHEGGSDSGWQPATSDFSDNGWLPLVRHLRECEGLKDATFFSIQKKDTFGGSPVFLFSRTPKYQASSATYKVNGGRQHTIVLYLPFVDKTSYPQPELKIRDTVASVSGPFLRQRSFGIEADFEVVFKRSFQQEISMLELRLPREPGPPILIKAPEFQSLIIVRVAWLYLLVAVFLLAVGGILAVISPAFIDELAKTGGIMGTKIGNWLEAHKLAAFILTKILSFLALWYLP